MPGSAGETLKELKILHERRMVVDKKAIFPPPV
jgi:hypothetical protein